MRTPCSFDQSWIVIQKQVLRYHAVCARDSVGKKKKRRRDISDRSTYVPHIGRPHNPRARTRTTAVGNTTVRLQHSRLYW